MFGLSQILLWFLFYIFLSYFFISLSPPAHLFVYSHLVWAVEAHILQVPQLNTILKAVVQEFYHFYATLCFNSTASQMDILYLLPLSLSLSHYKTKTKIFDRVKQNYLYEIDLPTFLACDQTTQSNTSHMPISKRIFK